MTYTVTAHNTGPGAYTDEEPARVVDDLTDVARRRHLQPRREADVGADPRYDEPRIFWHGALGADETVTITYTVTLAGGGDGTVRNVAWAPVPGTDPGPTPDCDDPATTVPCDEVEDELPRLSIEKTASDTELTAVGQLLTYTVHVVNDGPGDYTADAPASFTDDLSAVLDDATFEAGSIDADIGTASFADPELSWTGVLAAGEDATITYQVRYTGDGDTSLVNAACVPEDQATDPAEDCATVTLPGADLSQTKSSDPADGDARWMRVMRSPTP